MASSTHRAHTEYTADTSRHVRALRDLRMRHNQVTGGINTAWLKVGAAIYGVKKAWDVVQSGARAMQERKSFENLAKSYGANAKSMIADIREAANETVDLTTIINKAGTAMMLGIEPRKISKLMEIARATSKQTGQDVTEAFDNITRAVGRQSRMILDNLGIIVKVGDANKKYAEKLGKTSEQLTEAEKKQAFLNATLIAGEDLMKRMGDQTGNLTDRMAQYTTAITNYWQQMKIGFAQTFADIADVVTGKENLFNMLFSRKRAPREQALDEAYFGAGMDFPAAGSQIPTPAGPAPAKDIAFGAIDKDLSDAFGAIDEEAAAIDARNEMRLTKEAQYFEHLNSIRETQLNQEVNWELQRIENEDATEKKIQQIKERGAAAQARTMGTLWGGLLSFAKSKSKALFLILKGVEIGKAIAGTHSAAAQALALPPAPNFPAQAAALKAGYWNVAAIAATTATSMAAGAGGSSGGGGGSGGSFGGGSSIPAINVGSANESRPQTIFNIMGPIINDDDYIDSLVEKINAAEDRDVTINFAGRARELE